MTTPADIPPDDDAAITNCDPRLSFACPKTWGRLQATDDPLVRRCRVCSQPVRYLADASELTDTRAAIPSDRQAVPDTVSGFFDSVTLSGEDFAEEDSEEETIEEVADAAMALISALESQDPEAATGDLIFVEDD